MIVERIYHIRPLITELLLQINENLLDLKTSLNFNSATNDEETLPSRVPSLERQILGNLAIWSC